ncbi:MAG: DNA double-strand break repair nuclease NurA [Chloroflexi bacterium]|nr:DNA double-strand break repair nuclease NurA [Chloroflexota bacterium]
MTLELSQILPQIEQAVDNLRASSREHALKKEIGLRVLRQQDSCLDQLKEKLKAARTTWLVAGLTGGLANPHSAPSLPPDFAVLAVDGSSIDFDRHRALSCYLLNTGLAYLRYGRPAEARLESYAALYSSPEDMALKDPGGSGQEQRMDSALLGIKRTVEEYARAALMVEGLAPGIATLALFDGSLILWGLTAQNFPDFVVEAFLGKGLLRHLDRLHQASLAWNVSVASYISYPGGADVVNVLRVALCPFSPPDCDRYCSFPGGGPGASPKERPCAGVAGLRDRDLFQEILKPGERSDIFVSLSSVVNQHYGKHRTHFFYLNAGEEMARVEVPMWVAEKAPLLDLTHAAIVDQCRRGRGYPVALQEAHEKAVVTGADREAFWSLVTRELMQGELSGVTSAKSSSKRLRWL